MKPHSLGTVQVRTVHEMMPLAEKRTAQGWASRHGLYWAKGTALPETQVPACPRVKVADLPEGHLKKSHIERLEQNQLIASCCRHPENHEVEALKSHKDEPAPDIYIFHCDQCKRKHRFFCVGQSDDLPVWEAA